MLHPQCSKDPSQPREAEMDQVTLTHSLSENLLLGFPAALLQAIIGSVADAEAQAHGINLRCVCHPRGDTLGDPNGTGVDSSAAGDPQGPMELSLVAQCGNSAARYHRHITKPMSYST